MTLAKAKKLVQKLSRFAELGDSLPVGWGDSIIRVKYTVRGHSYWIDDVDYSLRQFEKALTLMDLE